MPYGSSIKKSLSCLTNGCGGESVSNRQKNSMSSELYDDMAMGSHENAALQCKLTESKLGDRKNKLNKVVFSKAKDTKELENGFIFSFPYNESFLLTMTEYVIAEKKCCPFFNFEIKLHQKNDIRLELTGPIGAKKMIEMFLTEIRESHDRLAVFNRNEKSE